MNRRSFGFLIIASLVLAAACQKTSQTTNGNSTPSKSATPDAFAATRALYTKQCKECHGDEGKGGPVKLEDGTKLKVPSLREGHALHHPDSDFVKQITKGGDGMPAFKDKMTSAEINDMVKFVRHEFQPGITPPN